MANANVIKLKNRQGQVVLPLTRSQLVQVSQITGLNLAEGKNWSAASVQDALEALYTYASTNNAGYDKDILQIQNALQSLLETTGAVKNYVDSQDTAYLGLAYAEAATKATEAKTDSYNYVDSKDASNITYVTGTTIKEAIEALQEGVKDAKENGGVTSLTEATNGAITVTNSEGKGATTVGVKVDGTSIEISSDQLAVKEVAASKVTLTGGEDLDTAYTNLVAKVGATDTAISNLTLSEVGGTGKVVTTISQANGQVSATAIDMSAANTSYSGDANITTVQGAITDLYAKHAEAESDLAVTINDNATPGEGILKVYTISQGGTEIGTINIPKDLVVTSGQVITATAEDTGCTVGEKYLKLTIANQTAPVYIAVADLVDVYTDNNQGTEVIVDIDASNNITASVGTIAASKISYANGAANATVQTELTSLHGEVDTLNGDENTAGSVAKAVNDLKTELVTSYTAADEALQTQINNLTAGMTTIDEGDVYTQSYLTVSNKANSYTLTLRDIASDTNLQALQTSYNTMNTELNSGVFYDELSGWTIDDITLTNPNA